MEKDPKLHLGHYKRVRRQVMSINVHQITDVLALEMMLQFTLRRGDTNEIARRILDKFGSFSQFCKLAHYETLVEIEGIANNIAEKLLCFCKLIQFATIRNEDILNREVVSLESIFRFLEKIYQDSEKESVYMFVLNKHSQLVHYTLLATGTPETVSIDSAKIAEITYLYNGSGIVIAHNHPIGSFYPSVADIKATGGILAYCKSNNIVFHDHIIINHRGYFSFKCSGLLKMLDDEYTLKSKGLRHLP